MTELYLDYNASNHMVRQPDPDDPWDIGDTVGDYWITGVHLSPGMRDYYSTAEEIKLGDDVYVVYASYATSCTFGQTGSDGQIIAVTKNSDLASAAAKWAQMQYQYEPSSEGWPDELPSINGCRWIGNFERLIEIRIIAFTVNP